MSVTPEELVARGREAYKLLERLFDFHVWVGEQNAEVTKQLKLHEQRCAIVRLVRAKAGREGLRFTSRPAQSERGGAVIVQARSPGGTATGRC